MSPSNTQDMPPGAIAIIGMAGRFPQAKDLEAFWQNLRAGKEVVRFFSAEELIASGIDPELVQNPNYVPARAFLEDADQFDAGFFGYSPREAEIIDPQQRLFLECAWETLENAGYDPGRYEGAIGVYGGLSMNTYLLNNVLARPDVLASAGEYQMMLGNDKDFLTTRVSYKLNLKGPSVNVQTACSTSLVAVQMACQSLLNYQCDLALAGGVSAYSPRISGYLYQPGMILSPDGHCRAFDHRAQGIVGGEGVGIVALKRYTEAVKDGDTIHAVIRGAAINNDGSLKVGYTAPSVDGQTKAILMAQAIAGVNPDSITYIEAHGTGTELGDPIEIGALTQAFRTRTQEKGFCAVGSVKTHMGHLDAAAGVAGLLKTVLALEHKTLPPSLNFEKPNPRIDFDNSPFFVNTQPREWKTNRLPRRAGVSAFGIGGTNAHVVLEEAPAADPGSALRGDQALILSARSETALNAASQDLAAWLREHPDTPLADAAYTLQIGRKVMKHRRIIVCSSAEEGADALESRDPKRVFSGTQEAIDNPVAFLFPGQGAQYVNMCRGLYETEPFFREQIDGCVQLLRSHLDLDLRDVLYPPADCAAQAEALIQQTWITQPALFTIEYSLAKLWISWGIHPKTMVGHSIGEYVAACLAGVFSLEDSLALVAARGKMMQALPAGGMLSIPLSEQEILPLLDKLPGEHLSVATINAPKMCVVSGPNRAIDALDQELSGKGIACRRLHTSHAFHSSMMEPILDSFTSLVQNVDLHAPKIPYLSNVTGDWITADQATSPAYWARHIRQAVRFHHNMEALFKDAPILLEVGPGQTLSTLARQYPQKPAGQVILTSARHPQDQASDAAFITTTLGRLWLSGASPDWKAYHQGEVLHRTPLPTYPFERKRYWIEPNPRPSQPQPAQAAPLTRRKDVSSWFYAPSWQRSTWPASQTAQDKKEGWLIFSDSVGIGQALANQLEMQGHSVVMVEAGSQFSQTSEDQFTIQPDAGEQYAQLIETLSSRNSVPTHMAHLWTVTAEPQDSLEKLEDIQRRGFYSLLSLAQAIGDKMLKNKIHLLVVSNGLHRVTGEETVDAAKATVLGPCRVISQEYENILCRSVDISLPTQPITSESPLVSHLLAELDNQVAEPVVAYRGIYRWTQTYVPRPLPESASEPIPFREKGVYLITGGYGGIGLALAKYLAQTVKGTLVLFGRTGLPDRSSWQDWLDHHDPADRTSQKMIAIQEMEKSGGSILLLQGDVADLDQMKLVIAQAKSQFGVVNGIIHAAGIAGDGIIQLKTKERADQVLAPKVRGTWILDQVTQNEALDFVLLCSSIQSVIGGIGQVDYCAANAFLDAYAQNADTQQDKPRVISVNWSAWQEVGMAVDTEVPAHLLHRKEENLRNGMKTTEGIEAFRRILENSHPQIIVAPIDVLALIEMSRKSMATTVEQSGMPAVEINPDPKQEKDQANNRPEVTTSYSAATNDIERKLVEIWENLIGIQPIGIHDNFFELGGHSLMATQILARLRDIYHVELPLRAFFEDNTIARLGKRIEAMLWVDQNRETKVVSSENREEFEL